MPASSKKKSAAKPAKAAAKKSGKGQVNGAAAPATSLSALLDERRVFPPPEEFVRQANVSDPAIYKRAARNLEAFWAEQAKRLDWFTPWAKVLEWKAPWAKWFVGGKLNVAYNCVDRHAHSARRNKAAIIWEGEPGDSRVLTYGMLEREVNRFANSLRSLGVLKGDRVAIYMGMVPELAIAMLACAKIGAPHSIVFGGFSAEALRERINDAKAKLVITCDGAWRRGSIVPLKASVDEALRQTPTVENVVVVRRIGDAARISMEPGRDIWWHEIVASEADHCPPRAWTPKTCSSSSTPAAPPASPRASCTPPAAISPALPPPTTGSSTSRNTTSTGAPPISAGSPAIPMSSTGRWPMARPRSCTRARPTIPTATASGRSLTSTASTSSTPPPRRSAPSCAGGRNCRRAIRSPPCA